MKIQERVEKSVSTLGYFTLNQWQFDTRNIMKLLDRIPEVDRSVSNTIYKLNCKLIEVCFK